MMRNLAVFLLALILPLSAACAHPASSIEAKISAATLELNIRHSSQAPQSHYIEKVEVSLNGVVLIRQSFLAQPDNSTQRAVYIIPSMKSGDKLEVLCSCNRGGDLRKDFTVN